LVRRGSREIYLCRKEFDLLHFFFRHQGKVLSKIRILEGVWDSNSDALTNTLEVHILKLRRKIENGATERPRLIHTVYGRGYLFGLRAGSGAMPTTGMAPLN
jgi:DNA-binding response OmpR family regulator